MGQVSSSCSVSCTHHNSNQLIITHASSKSDENGRFDLTLSLPDECLAFVFGKLGCRDRNTCSLVCRRWKLVDSKSRQRLVLLSRSEISPSLRALLSRFSSVSILSLKCSRKLLSIDDDAFSRIPLFLTSLKKLKLKGCVDVSDDGLHAFSLYRLCLLTKLSFASCGFGATGLNSLLSNCPSLRDLTLKRLRKLDAQNIPLHSAFEALDYVSVDKKKKTHNQQLQLERLCLKDLHNARIFIPLISASSKDLKTLVVCRSSGNWDRVLESLQGRITAISDVQMENVQLSDAGLIAISSSCPDLQILSLSRTADCTDEGLSAIANSCKKLRKLHVDAWSRFGSRTIGDQGVLSIANKCSQLQEMVLMGVPITIPTLRLLAINCQTLERLALCNTDSVGDSELALIASKFAALKKLCIKNCPISESGIAEIGDGCPNLVKLKIKRCKGITQASLSKLGVRRSSLVVSVDAGSLLFDGDGRIVAEEEDQGIHGSRMPQPLPSTRSTTTHLICSSRGALLLRSKFENALQLNRRRP